MNQRFLSSVNSSVGHCIFPVFAEDPANVQQGVYLFLGYSEKDESLLKKVTNQGAIDALGAIQGLVSYHNVNANKVSREIITF